MTPTYPVLAPSYIDGVSVAKMKLFNRREDVGYYQILVYTEDWLPISFASEEKIIKIGYNKTKSFNVYVRSVDLDKTVYICTVSKVFKGTKQIALVSSMICSKIKQ
jgi:hypothetical protein